MPNQTAHYNPSNHNLNENQEVDCAIVEQDSSDVEEDDFEEGEEEKDDDVIHISSTFNNDKSNFIACDTETLKNGEIEANDEQPALEILNLEGEEKEEIGIEDDAQESCSSLAVEVDSNDQISISKMEDIDIILGEDIVAHDNHLNADFEFALDDETEFCKPDDLEEVDFAKVDDEQTGLTAQSSSQETSLPNRKRKWTSPVSLRGGFFKGISLESLNILRKSVSQPNSETSSFVPSENNSEVNSESNSTEASDDENTEAPVKKLKVDQEEIINGVEKQSSLSRVNSSSIILAAGDQMQAYNPFSLPRLRGFFSRILNRVL